MLEINKIYCMDCLKGLPKLNDASIDVIVTSPPYNIGKPYRSYNDVRPRDEYLDWMETHSKKMLAKVKRERIVFS